MPDAEDVTERWVYVGRSLDYKTNKIGYDWRDDTGRVMRFGKVRGSVIGGTYEVEVERKEGGGVAVVPNPHYVPDVELAADTLVLQARDKLVYESKQRVDAENRAARNTALGELLAPLEEAAAGCRTYDDVEALISVVSQAMRKARRRG